MHKQMSKTIGTRLRTRLALGSPRRGSMQPLPLQRARPDAVTGREPARAKRACRVPIDGAAEGIEQVPASRRRLPSVSKPPAPLAGRARVHAAPARRGPGRRQAREHRPCES